MPDARIPALKEVGLDVVPGFTRLPDATEDPEWRRRYFTWYENARDWRLDMQKDFAKDEEFANKVLSLCAKDSAFFALCFLVVEEPRAMTYFDKEGLTLDAAYALLHSDDDDISVGDLGYQTIHPFIPFAYQVEAHRLCTRVILGPMRTFNHDILWDKARGVGMSYAILAWAYWGWLFVKGLRGTILTEKWDKAERTKDINSLFGKFDLFLDYTPDILIPEGFTWRGEKDSDRLLGRLVNPENGAAIYTEPTTADATRSGREAYVAVDELNFHQYLKKTWATIHGTTFHCLGWTTASRRYGRQGETIIKEGQKEENRKSVTVKVLEWWDNPHQDHAWMARTKEQFRAAGMIEEFETEYLRNPTANSGRLVYLDQLETLGDAAWTTEGYDPTKPLYGAVDPAASDFTAWVFWQKHFKDEQKKIRWLEAAQRRNMPVQFWIHVLTGILPRPAWVDDHGIKHPPDEMYKYFLEGFFDEPDIKRMMTFIAQAPTSSLLLYGDPSMASNTITHDSWEAVFTKGTRELRTREYGADDPRAVSIQCRLPWKPLYKRNNYQDQRVGMREALTMSEFYKGSDGVQWFYDCVKNTMFQETTERSTRAPGHLHTDEYHVVSAAQYGMTWETLKLTPNEIDALRQDEVRASRPKALRRNVPVRAPSYRPRDKSLPAGVL